MLETAASTAHTYKTRGKGAGPPYSSSPAATYLVHTMSDTAESAGALGTLFFYVLFVHPVCAWILAPKRFRKDRAIIYAILFLATIAIGKMVRVHKGCGERGGLASALFVPYMYLKN